MRKPLPRGSSILARRFMDIGSFWLPDPILDGKSINPTKLTFVVSDHHDTKSTGMRSDPEIVIPDQPTSPLEFIADFPVPFAGFRTQG